MRAKVIEYMYRFWEIDDMKIIKNENILHKKAMHDEAWLQQRYEEVCQTFPGEYCFVSIKIKRLRIYNRLFGRAAGKQLILDVHKVIQDFIEPYEYIAHIHAGCFNLLMKLPEAYDDVHLRFKALNDLFSDMSDPYDAGRIYIGIGIYRMIEPQVTFSIAQYNADIARAESKEAAFKNTHFEVYGEGYHDHNLSDFRVEHSFKEALEKGYLCFYLQPKVDLKTGTVEGAEALVRWKDPQRGLVPLAEFLPAFEASGLIEDLDLYIFEKVCELINYYLKTYQKKIKISVNLSGSLFNYRFFFDLYKEIHEQHPCPKDCIEIELLESIVLNQVDQVRNAVEQIHTYGFTCSLDDFGSGYSSFSILTEVNIDSLKIDQSLFRKDLHMREKSILRHIIEMAKELDMKVIAEGVEKREYVKFLADLKCDAVQGYVFYKPMPVEEFEERFVKGNERADISFSKE